MIKAFIAIAFMLFQVNAFAYNYECESELKSYFQMFQKYSEQMSSARKGVDISDIKMTMGNPEGDFAISWWSKREIQFSWDLCNQSKDYKMAVAAHEWGHILSFAIYDNYRKSITSRRPEFTPWQYEWVANEIASQMYREMFISKDNYLAELDSLCSKNKEYFCDTASAWRSGSIR